MRILHTSDWHLGRHFHGMALDEDHDAILSQIETAIAEHRPDLLIIAGDIFDRAGPPQSALHRFGAFIRRVTEASDLAVVAIAGNHDSAAQIGMMDIFASGGRSLVRGPLEREEQPLILPDADGPIAVSALPFAYEFAARACFEDDSIASPADVMRAQVESARRHVPAGARWIIVAHAFVAGAATSDNERSLARVVGGIETVPASTFDGAHYVALGHLHRPQAAGAPHIRYSGAPLAFGLDEEGDIKSLTLVDLAADGTATTSLLPLVPNRKVRNVRGTLAELTALSDICEDFTGIILNDETPQIDAMKRLRAKFPNAVQLTYAARKRPAEVDRSEVVHGPGNPAAIMSAFMRFIRDDDLSEAETAIVETLLAEEASGEIGA